MTSETRLDLTAGGIVLLAYVFVQLKFLQGPQPYDPAYYFSAAVDFPDVRANLLTIRLGVIAPVRAAVLLFGPSEAALYAVPMAAGLILVGAVYGIMLLLFRDRLLAAAAALVTALHASYLLKSSSIFPDTLATATFTAGVFGLVLGATRPGDDERAWQRTVFIVCAGVLFGWTYLVREFSLILFPTVATALVLLRYPLRHVAILGGSALATVSLELLYGFLVFRDPLVHVRLLLDRGETPVGARRAERLDELTGELDTILDTFLVFPRLVLAWHGGWVFVLLVTLFVVALAVRFRDKRLWLLGVWCFSFWITMAVLGLVYLPSGRWILNITNIRYWYPIFPPLVMGGFGALGLLLPKQFRIRGVTLGHAVAGGLAALILVPGAVQFERCAATNVRPWVNDPAERWHDLRAWLALPAASRYDVLWTDGMTMRLVPAFASTTFGSPLWSGAFRDLGRNGDRLGSATDLQRSVVLIHKDRLTEGHLRSLRERLHDWSPIFVSDDNEMVVLARTPAPTNEAGHTETWWMPSDDGDPAADPGSCPTGRGT